jgi:hypothetical protein
MLKTQKPWMGNAFVFAEGIKSIDIGERNIIGEGKAIA